LKADLFISSSGDNGDDRHFAAGGDGQSGTLQHMVDL
jgi:hypothetical protein